jgi:hypothetical protein
MTMIILGVLFTILLFLCGVLGMMYTNLRENDNNLQKLNHKLNEDINELTTKNAILHSEVISRTEERAVKVGSTVTWLDKQKEIETGSVLDDYKHNNKIYVVVIRLKDGKTQGAPISIPIEKLTISS